MPGKTISKRGRPYGIAAGRLVAFAPERSLLEGQVNFLRLRYPELDPTLLFTGPYNFGGEIIV